MKSLKGGEGGAHASATNLGVYVKPTLINAQPHRTKLDDVDIVSDRGGCSNVTPRFQVGPFGASFSRRVAKTESGT
jgi:hypothetical protein